MDRSKLEAEAREFRLQQEARWAAVLRDSSSATGPSREERRIYHEQEDCALADWAERRERDAVAEERKALREILNDTNWSRVDLVPSLLAALGARSSQGSEEDRPTWSSGEPE